MQMALQFVPVISFVFQGLIINVPYPSQNRWLVYEDHRVPLQGHRNDHHRLLHFEPLMEYIVPQMLFLCNNQGHVLNEDLMYIAHWQPLNKFLILRSDHDILHINVREFQEHLRTRIYMFHSCNPRYAKDFYTNVLGSHYIIVLF